MKKPANENLKQSGPAAAPFPDELEAWTVVGRGPISAFAKPASGAATLGQLRRGAKSSRARVVTLAADVARQFRGDADVNEALRKYLKVKDVVAGRLRKAG